MVMKFPHNVVWVSFFIILYFLLQLAVFLTFFGKSFVDVYALHYYLLVVMKPLVLLHNYNNINSAKQEQTIIAVHTSTYSIICTSNRSSSKL